KCLCVAYRDGMIDIIHDDGRLVSNSAIRDYLYPCDKRINSVTADIDGHSFYVATGFGFLTVDASTGGLSSFRNTGKDIRYAARVGERMVLIADDGVYVSSLNALGASADELQPLKCDPRFAPAKYVTAAGELRDPSMILPLSDDTFIYLTHAEGKETVGPYVNMAVMTDAGVGVFNLSESVMNYDAYGYNRYGRYDDLNVGLVTPTRDGYMVNTTAGLVHISRNVTFDAHDTDCLAGSVGMYKSSGVNVIPKTGFGKTACGASENALPMATYDGVSYWMYRPTEGFSQRTVSWDGSNAVWGASGPVWVPDAGGTFIATYMEYHPDHGLLMRNHGVNEYFESNNNNLDGLSGYKDGEWSYYGLNKTNYARRQVSPAPSGLAIDPVNPKYIWAGSRENGLTRLNLEDPTDILRMVRSNIADVGQPGCYAVHDYAPDWIYLSCFSPVAFDSDGTLWTQHCDWNLKGDKIVYSLWYLTADERRASENASRDPAAFIKPHRIDIPVSGVTLNSLVWPMSMECNRNLVGVTANQYFDSVLLDHNGTLDDTSDDSVVYIANVYDDSGNELELNRGSYMFEDPYDGALLISYEDGILVTTRDELFTDGLKRGRMLEAATDAGSGMTRPVAQCRVTGIAVDAEGRKWIATSGDGLYCISEDRSRLLAHYVQETGGLPSSLCTGCVYNPGTRSVWVGTANGTVEFVPDGGGEVSQVSDRVQVSPACVTPDYFGYITISGLNDSERYQLRSSDGDVLMELYSRNGRADIEAPVLPAGIHLLCGSDGKVVEKIIRNK
ncbi:MAG: hypothetical protein K2M03_00990, partial [Muribaculaceae bacterium]|nr:hypothetical protein [Muribaculaceae bacterium]